MTEPVIIAQRQAEVARKRLKATRLEFEGACIMDDAARQETLRAQAHDLLDMLLDASAATEKLLNQADEDDDDLS